MSKLDITPVTISLQNYADQVIFLADYCRAEHDAIDVGFTN
jgi:hypothetical protein